jgi:type II secretory pathway pseudopilin PulG
MRREDGYAMVALLVAMAVMAIMMTAALPVWKTTAQREKEAELIFRGEQYARAIRLYQAKIAGALPPSIDLLVEQRFLRKKYKDPITNDDFQVLSAGQTAGVGIPGAQQNLQNAAAQLGGRAGRAAVGQAGPVVGGITGVVSKSTETSLRLYNNRNKYNEWTFVFVQPAQGRGAGQPGVGGQRQGAPGPGRGQPGRGGAQGRGGAGQGNIGPFTPVGPGAQGGQVPGGRRGL